MYATVFVPEGKVGYFLDRFEKYAHENHPRSGKPWNERLVASIEALRLATLGAFWTDRQPFPATLDTLWLEVWLRDTDDTADVAEQFRQRARAVGVLVGPRELRFPERRVVCAQASLLQLTQVENLFDLLAELRLARTPPSEFLSLRPRDQAEFIEDVRARIVPPPGDAPAVCHLDTGVNRAHPLLELALSEEHVLSVDPQWSTADKRGHGTAMAGVALYGDLKDLLNHTDTVQLRHRLESVKILPDTGSNDPDLYGALTSQAASRIEIATAEQSRRVYCLTVTADGEDEGLPSSWSGAVDQICSGADESGNPRRLVIVSAGNVLTEDRRDYPDRNMLSGIKDPAQAWNAITVGACTHLATIYDADYRDWKPMARPGALSPASRTSVSWEDRSWPLKPDIVMEGGNDAISPDGKHVDSVDDLGILTTRMSATGARLTTTGDTSAAAALTARHAAIIWAHYPELWPETVRALLVHSARWTPAMHEELAKQGRENHLRAYGYGVPDLQRALWSVSNATALVIEDSLQPFHKVGSDIKTCEMHLHNLPWPVEVLQELADLEVCMRVTLSYFVEPSPGSRGWTYRHRYSSHGFRFDVKRPLETEQEFHKRISRDAWEEDEERNSHGRDARNWMIGSKLRTRGSLHCDTWVGTAAELASSGLIAVYPVSGWWKERKHLGKWNRTARYSLVVSIETDATEVDLYTPIAAQVGIPVANVIET
ncbi:S8 family peptidase [Maioricimonas sp. JC845]|uniref:S8 family peptidase n=1 Tax=Maioricimonas sp. JC845 TaxID=3232138 RepID=UPI003458A7FE